MDYMDDCDPYAFITIPREVFDDLAGLWLGTRNRHHSMSSTNAWLLGLARAEKW